MLADRYPESSAALRFYGAVASFQKDGSAEALLALVATTGPELLRDVARELDSSACESAVEAWASGADRSSPKSFFGRVLLQAQIRAERDRCPVGDGAPQVGCWVRQGDGTALALECSICFHRQPKRKAHCPACDASSLVHYHADELQHLDVLACDGCHQYINVVRLHEAPDAVPDVDEITALPLDVWASEKGYRKMVRNLVGI